MSKTLDKFIIRWSCLQSSHTALIISAWLFFHRAYKINIELIWFPKNCGSKRDNSSSIIKLPLFALQRLKVRRRYSGIYLSGASKRLLTLWKWCESDRINSRSTRSTESQTCKNSVVTLSLIPISSSIVSCLLSPALRKLIDFSFFSM